MEKLNEHIEFLEMTEDEPQLLCWLLELRRHREDNWKQRAEAAEAKLIPNGWQLVPVEPTPEMLDSPVHEMLPMVHHDSMRERARMIRRHGWRVMLAAAPEPD